MDAIQIEGLTKTYGQVHALDGLTLSVPENTVFGFLGPNGAGKTTTIRLLTGLAHPSGGRAWVAGEEVGKSGRASHITGYLPEEPAFYGWMTPLELLDHVGRLFGMSAALRRQRSKYLLELAGLESAARRRIAGFSRGMRQRLGLAQALVNRPAVLFLDEPVSALDPAGRKEVLDLIEHLRGQCTIFMSTHILSDVERVCDVVGIIKQGRLVVEAGQHELLARYTVPAFELEVEPADETAFKPWLDGLHAQAWFQTAAITGPVARVVVNDVQAARQILLAEAVRSGLALRRFEIVTPSLEDVFLRLVNGEEVRP